jgi:hypothetical protein
MFRQAGWRLTMTGAAGTLLLISPAGIGTLDRELGAGGRIASSPVAVPVGLGVAYLLDRRRAAASDVPDSATEIELGPSNLRSLVVAGGVVGRWPASLTASTDWQASSATGWRLQRRRTAAVELTGHGATLALLGSGAAAVYGRAMRRIVAGTSAMVPVLDADEASRWTGPTVSGGPGSLVPWETLGREGRRHALTPVRPRTFADRPPGSPDLSIQTVMGEPALATPVQVYIGLDSAPPPGNGSTWRWPRWSAPVPSTGP